MLRLCSVSAPSPVPAAVKPWLLWLLLLGWCDVVRRRADDDPAVGERCSPPLLQHHTTIRVSNPWTTTLPTL